MASFEEAISRHRANNEVQKFPVKRFDIAIQRFIKVLNIEIDRLDKHRNNIIKFQRLEEWKNLKREQVNATRTVQQLKANLRDLERTRDQVQDDEVGLFDEKVQDIHQKAMQESMSFIDVFREGNAAMTAAKSSQKQNGDCTDANYGAATFLIDDSLGGVQTQCTVDNQRDMESWQNLGQSLQELNMMISEFAMMVHQQQEKVDRIEDNIESTHGHVQGGVKNLSQASKYKAAMFPVIGAVIGGVCAGPVGLIAGAKLGGVAGLVGGSALGFASGRYMKKKQENANTVELENLSESTNSTNTLDISGK